MLNWQRQAFQALFLGLIDTSGCPLSDSSVSIAGHAARVLLLSDTSPTLSLEESPSEQITCEDVEHSHCAFHTPISTLRGIAIATIFVAGAIGIGSPVFLRRLGVASDNDLFLIFKAFGAGVIMTTGLGSQLH